MLTSIAREIALDINPIKTILKHHHLDREAFVALSQTPAFKKILEEQVAAWNSSLNIGDRLRIKQLAMIEGSLEELYGKLHDPKEPLNAKVELFKALSRNGGIGVAAGEGTGEKVQITINMGADKKLAFEKAPPMIEGEVIS